MKTHVVLVLDGKEHQLLPGARALLEVAEKVGDPMSLVLDLSVGITPPKTLHVIRTLVIALKASGYEISEADAEQALFAKGVQSLWAPYGEFIGALINGGKIPDKAPETKSKGAKPKKAVARPRK